MRLSRLALVTALVFTVFALPLSAAPTAALASGRSIVTWTVEPDQIHGQIVDASGQPAGPELLLAEGGTPESLTADPSGGFVLSWRSQSLDQVLVRHFDAAGAPLGETVLLADEADGGAGLTRGPEMLVHQASSTSSGLENATIARGASGTLVGWVENRALYVRLVDSTAPLAGIVSRVSPEGIELYSPRLVPQPNGFLAVWTSLEASRGVQARFLDPFGQPVGPMISLIEGASVADVDAVRGGGFLLVWYASSEDLRARRFDATGAPAGPEILLGEPSYPISAAAGPDGGFTIGIGGVTRVYRPDGTRARAISNLGGEIEADAAGRFVVAWKAVSSTGEPDQLRFQRLSADGLLLGPPITVEVERSPHELALSDLSVRPDGSFLLLWESFGFPPSGIPSVEGDVLARAYNAAGEPLGPAIRLPDQPEPWEGEAKATPTEDGWNVSWGTLTSAPGPESIRFRPLSLPAHCAADRLCLNGQRFRVEVDWHVPHTGESGSAQPLGLTGDTGAFWFFDPQNAELVVKVLDGTAINGHFWVFYGSLTNVRFDLTVTDTLTGQRRVYRNPAGTLASRADTQAFPAGATADAPSLAPPVSLAAAEVEIRQGATDQAGCVERAYGICLNDRRFRLEVDFRVPSTGLEGAGRPQGLSDDTALFWFFHPTNIDLLVKVLDGTGINGHFWVFYGTLTDLEVDLTVTDTATGAQRIYHKPAGQLASEADTEAF